MAVIGLPSVNCRNYRLGQKILNSIPDVLLIIIRIRKWYLVHICCLSWSYLNGSIRDTPGRACVWRTDHVSWVWIIDVSSSQGFSFSSDLLQSFILVDIFKFMQDFFDFLDIGSSQWGADHDYVLMQHIVNDLFLAHMWMFTVLTVWFYQ